MRVQVTATGLTTYPDLVVVCGEPQFLDRQPDTLLNPTIIIEVLSRSTEAYDRGEKFRQYRTLESLREYCLISSEGIQVDLFTLREGLWVLTSADRLEDTVEIQSIGCHLALARIYSKVEFEPAPLRPQNT